MKTAERKYHVVKGVYSQTVGDETVLLDINGEEYFGLNKVGTIIWNLLEEENTLQEIQAKLAKSFNHDPAAIKDDINNLITDLIEAGLIQEKI